MSIGPTAGSGEFDGYEREIEGYVQCIYFEMTVVYTNCTADLGAITFSYLSIPTHS